MKEFDEQAVEKELFNSLHRLTRERLYGYLIHKFDNFLKYKGLHVLAPR